MTYDSLRAQYAKNAVQLGGMLETSRNGGGKVYRGFALAELEKHHAMALRMSKATDAELAETFAGLQRAFGKSLNAIGQQIEA